MRDILIAVAEFITDGFRRTTSTRIQVTRSYVMARCDSDTALLAGDSELVGCYVSDSLSQNNPAHPSVAFSDGSGPNYNCTLYNVNM